MHALRSKLACTGILLFAAGVVHADSDVERLIEQAGIREGAFAMRDLPGWRTPKKVVMLDIGLPLDEIREELSGVELIVVNTMSEVFANARGADALMGRCTPRIAAVESVTWVQVFSAGVERCVAADRIADGSVVLTNMQKMSSPTIAEHTIAMMLALARGLPQYAKVMPDGRWTRGSAIAEQMVSIDDKRLLIVGLGGIGTEIARRGAALGMRVSATRRTSREGPGFVDYVGLSDELPELAAEADFIVNALPLTPETTGLFDKAFFDVAKRGAFFLSVGRGASVVTDDLVAALESGQIAGAGLDVTDPEPLPADHPLWQVDNVIITPHVSSRGGNRTRRAILVRENLKRFVAGDALLNVVDPEYGY